jgi:tRNA threonylcarbamoyladenosine biosynthesis protein TsaE
MEFHSSDQQQTFRLGYRLGQLLPAGSVVGLSGTLGAGKTRFVQGIGSGMGVPEDSIVSPTYTLCVPYQGGSLGLLHLDTYRIRESSEIDELGLEEYLADGVVLVIEWVERFQEVLPEMDLHISISLEPGGSRSLKFKFLNQKLREICGGLSSD